MRTADIRLLVVTAAALAAFAPSAAADIITFTDGSKVEGEIAEEIPPSPCKTCNKTGKIECPDCAGTGRVGGAPCMSCGGTGKKNCDVCDGKGEQPGRVIVLLKGKIRVSFSVRDIAGIERKPVPEEQLLTRDEKYEKLATGLVRGDAKAQFELGRWCFENGLEKQAHRHLTEAVALDAGYARQAAPFLDHLNGRLEAAAKKNLARAVEMLGSGDFASAAAVLEAALAEAPDCAFLKDARLQAEHIRREYPAIAAAWGLSLAEMASAARARALVACPECKGIGRLKCPDCGGTGDSSCPRCRGAGRMVCDNCNGTGRELCPRCMGTGREPKDRPVMGLGTQCTRCGGQKTVDCTACGGKRTVACATCGGTGKIKSGCKRCEGKGSVACPACLGTGFARVTAFRWGPAPDRLRDEVVVAERKGLESMWQGSERGALITVASSEVLFRDALAKQMNAVLGKPYRYVVVCIDNREGARQVRFSSSERTLRLVLDDAMQCDVVPADELAKKLASDEDLAKAAQQLADADVLPGVMQNVIAVLPPETDLKRVKSVFWGRTDPVKLNHRYLQEKEVEELRKTLK